MITTAINWISVADQLPDDDMTVLISDTENDVTLGFHDGDAGWRYCTAARVGDPITHWAELPDPPNTIMTKLPTNYDSPQMGDSCPPYCSRCIVHGCANHRNQGPFIGDLCAPCYDYITTGSIGPTTSFLGGMDKALDTLKVISVADWKTAGELRKMARYAYSSANARAMTPATDKENEK